MQWQHTICSQGEKMYFCPAQLPLHSIRYVHCRLACKSAAHRRLDMQVSAENRYRDDSLKQSKLASQAEAVSHGAMASARAVVSGLIIGTPKRVKTSA